MGVMRAIVLVKQVPDVRVGTVGMRPDGTIDRSSAAVITNPADLHAIEAALQVAGEVIAVTLGPPRAEQVLREAISLGADRGVLLSDRLFAGSDTWATANALAAALRRLGPADLVLAGISALDGETGHVGPQVAERLGWPHTTACEGLSLEAGRLIARRIVEGGYEVVSLPLPAVATISETGFTPRYPTLPGRRRGASSGIEVLTAADLGLDSSTVGLEASPTKVAHMELVPMPRRECRLVGEGYSFEDLVRELVNRDVFTTSEETRTDTGSGQTTSTLPAAADADVWVVCEIRDGGLTAISAELLSRAVDLGASLDTGVTALVLGSGVEEAVGEAAAFGADQVLVADDERLANFTGMPEARIIADAVRDRSPSVVLFGATTGGRSVAPRVAAMLDTGIAADCTDLFIADWERRGQIFTDLLHQVRPAMAGGVLATCLCPEARPQMATVRPGVFRANRHPKGARVENLQFELLPDDLAVEVLERTLQRTDVALAEADFIVAGGAGCNASNWHLVEDLAARIGGKVAASRAAVEAGLAPRSLQVGQTGSTIRPKLYIACGISGALQHVVGMRAAGTVVAINRDPDAAIFRFAQFGVVGDVTEVLPKLTAAFESVRG